MKNIVKELRGELSQSELAKRAGISQPAIALYELGRMPKPEILDKIAAAVGKEVIWTIKDRTAKDPSKTTRSVRREGVADGSATETKDGIF